MPTDHTSPADRSEPAARRWSIFHETGSTPPSDGGLQPSADPRTTPVPSGLEIHILEGEDAGKTFSLDTWEVVLGRRMTPEEKKVGWLLFNEPTVSRMHAVLEWRPGPRRYRIDHQSRTNPTLINGRQVQQAILYPDDLIRIGDLTFQLRVRTNKAQADGHHLQVPDRGLIYSGFKVSIVKGPDSGKQFTLDHKVLHIGGPAARANAGGDNWLIIEDSALPREQAFLVWYEAEKRYGIFHAGASPIPTQISRVLNQSHPAAQNAARNLLNVDDVVILGETALMFLKHERFLETGRAFQHESLRPLTGVKPGQPASPNTDSAPTPPAASPSVPAVAPTPSLLRENQAPDKASTDSATPPGSLVQRKPFDFASGRKIQELHPTEVHDDVPASLSELEASETDRPFEQTSNWFVRPDYVLEFLQGPELGRRITLKANAFRDDKPLTLGSRGRRNNAIEVLGPDVDNQTAQIHCRGGRFFLVRDPGATTSVSTNDIPLDPEEMRILKNGDEICIGPHVLLFIDRQALERQFQFELEVLIENGNPCSGRITVLNQELVTLGRSSQCSLTVADPNVSRQHAQISFGRGGFVLTHHSSTNPTFVNGVSLEAGQERLLEHGDEIHLSDVTTLVFRRRRALELN